MINHTLRLRIAIALGAGLLVLMAFLFGLSLVAALFTHKSDTTPYIGGGVIGRALPAGLLPAIAVGGLVGYLAHPVTRSSREQ